MTTIRFDKLTALGMLATWIDPDRSVEAEDVVYPPGLSPSEEETHRAISQMDQSKIDAAAVVLRMLTDYPRDHGAGALVEYVGPDCPADGRLFPGDLIVRIGGEPVDSRREASRLIDAVPVDEPIEFRVEADGEVHDVARHARDVSGHRRAADRHPAGRAVPVRDHDRERARSAGPRPA